MEIHKTETYRLYWQNPHKNRLVVHVLHPWSWDTAIDGILRMRQAIAAQPHDVYTIYHFEPGTALMPSSNTSLDNLLTLLRHNTPNEPLMIMVQQNTTFRLIFSAVARTFPSVDEISLHDDV